MSGRVLASAQKAAPQVKPKAKRPQVSPRAKQRTAERRKTEWHFAPSLVSGQGLKAVLQPALEVGPPDDEFEQEADRVADRIMTMPAGAASGDTGEREDDKLQRKPAEDEAGEETPVQQKTAVAERVCAECAEEEKEKGARVQRQEDVEEEPPSGVEPKVQRQEMEEEETAQTALLQRQMEEEPPSGVEPKIQRQEMEHEETAQTTPLQRACEACAEEEMEEGARMQRQEEVKEEPSSSVQLKILRQEMEEEEGTAQTASLQRRMEEDEEKPAQAAPLQRQDDEEAAQPGSLMREATQFEEEAVQAEAAALQRACEVCGGEEEEKSPGAQRRQGVEETQASDVQPKVQRKDASDEGPVPNLQTQDNPGDEALQTAATVTVQRACASCEEAKEKQEESASEEAAPKTPGNAQRAAMVSATLEDEELDQGASPDDPRGLQPRPKRQPLPSFETTLSQRRRAGGEPLPRSLQRFMEARFNQDFGRVRLHTDSHADALSRQIRARAFTVGRHIFFKRSEFQPLTQRGQKLVAHELTHVLQQRGGLHRLRSGGAHHELMRRPLRPERLGNIAPRLNVQRAASNSSRAPDSQAPEIEPMTTDELAQLFEWNAAKLGSFKLAALLKITRAATRDPTIARELAMFRPGEAEATEVRRVLTMGGRTLDLSLQVSKDGALEYEWNLSKGEGDEASANGQSTRQLRSGVPPSDAVDELSFSVMAAEPTEKQQQLDAREEQQQQDAKNAERAARAAQEKLAEAVEPKQSQQAGAAEGLGPRTQRIEEELPKPEVEGMEGIPAQGAALPVEALQVPLDAAGAPIPTDPDVDQAVIALQRQAVLLKKGGEALLQQAAAHKRNAQKLDSNIGLIETALKNTDSGIQQGEDDLEFRKTALKDARKALDVSENKAKKVAAEAPGFAEKAGSGESQAGGIASKARSLQPPGSDDPEASAKAQRAGGKIQKVANDTSSIKDAMSKTKDKASSLSQDAAKAAEMNAQTKTKLGEADKNVGEMKTSLAEKKKTTAAASQAAQASKAQPKDVSSKVQNIQGQGHSLIAQAEAITESVQTAQATFAEEIAAVPGVEPAEPAAEEPAIEAGGATLGGETPEGEVGNGGEAAAEDVAKQAQDEEEKRVDLVNELPSWLTGVEPPKTLPEAERLAQAKAAHDRRQAELALIQAAAGKPFSQLGVVEKTSLALGLVSFRALDALKSISWPNWPSAGAVAKALLDPRATLVGVLSGLSKVVNGVVDIAKGAVELDLGKILSGAADIATGLTIILASITALAAAIAALATLVTIVSLGAASPGTGPVIAFASSVMVTVGGWTIVVGKVALILQALKFIKSLIDAATAQTAEEVQTSADDMQKEFAETGNILLQMGTAKLTQLQGNQTLSAIEKAGGGVSFAEQIGAQTKGKLQTLAGGARAAPGAIARTAKKAPGAIAAAAKKAPGALASAAKKAPGAIKSGARAAAEKTKDALRAGKRFVTERIKAPEAGAPRTVARQVRIGDAVHDVTVHPSGVVTICSPTCAKLADRLTDMLEGVPKDSHKAREALLDIRREITDLGEQHAAGKIADVDKALEKPLKKLADATKKFPDDIKEFDRTLRLQTITEELGDLTEDEIDFVFKASHHSVEESDLLRILKSSEKLTPEDKGVIRNALSELKEKASAQPGGGLPTKFRGEHARPPGVAPAKERLERLQPLPDTITPEAALDKIAAQPSMQKLLDVGESTGAFSRDTAKEIVNELHAAGKVGGRVQDDVRGAVAVRLRKKLLDEHLLPAEDLDSFAKGTLDFAELERRSVKRFNEVADDLASADKGTLGEELVRKLKEAEPGLPKARGKQVEFAAPSGKTRKIDLIEGDTLVEVKSTSEGLGPKDLEQINDFADFVKTGEARRLGPGGKFEVDKLEVVMLNPEGASASLDRLTVLLEKNPNVTVKLFNKSGRSRIFDAGNASEMAEWLST